MIINITSMRYPITHYRDLLEDKVDFDKHLYYPNPEVLDWCYLKGIMVNTLEELWSLFSRFEEAMGEDTGHITVNVKTNNVLILDSWIE